MLRKAPARGGALAEAAESMLYDCDVSVSVGAGDGFLRISSVIGRRRRAL